ncbi:MAG: trigger factor family protein, partial [Pseudomonadota bacterium]
MAKAVGVQVPPPAPRRLRKAEPRAPQRPRAMTGMSARAPHPDDALMQATETLSEGLKREIAVTVDAAELDAKLNERIEEMKGTVRLKGFRPGKVPAKHLRQVYGRSIMTEVMEKTVTDTSRQILDERKERPAFQPDIAFPEDKDRMEQVIKGEADLTFDLKFEVLPEIKVTELNQIELEKPVAEVGD